MLEVLRAKFTQHATIASVLASTNGARLVEHTENDRYWGDGGAVPEPTGWAHYLSRFGRSYRRGPLTRSRPVHNPVWPPRGSPLARQPR
jgi:hypothetical protein